MTRRCLALVAAVLVPHLAPAVERYVDLYNTNATPPYTNWVTAASNIQHAVDECYPGDMIWVSNGLYDAGSAVGSDGWSCRVAVAMAVDIRSVNGRNVTLIKGDTSTRCVYLGAGAKMSGFTLTNGYAGTGLQGYGGGAYLQSATVSNCLFIANRAVYGGGSYGGTVFDCTFRTNWAEQDGGGTYMSDVKRGQFNRNFALRGGGAYGGTLEDCTMELNRANHSGGGIANATARRCTLWNNWSSSGGGCWQGTYENCLIYGNTASSMGGGADWANLDHCTIVDNLNQQVNGGGTRVCVLNNCILYNNIAVAEPANSNYNGCTISNSCTSPLPPGEGNIDANPLFVQTGVDYRLKTNSPCIDRGTNLNVITTDRDGVARPLDGNNDGVAWLDMGAYEFVHPLADTDGDRLRDTNEIAIGTSPILWDSDGDRYGDADEIGADCNPWDPASYLAVTGMAVQAGAGGVVLAWQSVTTRQYTVDRALALTNDNDWGDAPYTNIAARIAGLEGSTGYTDTTAVITRPAYYRVLASP